MPLLPTNRFARPVALVLLIVALASAGHAQVPVSPPAPQAVPAVPVPPPAAAAAVGPLKRPGEVVGSYKNYLSARYANEREALAAIHLFGRKKTGGLLWLLGGAAVLGALQSQTGTTVSSTGTRSFTISPLGYLVFGGLPAGIAIGKFSRFNDGRLYEVLSGYDATHSLPGSVVVKLRPSDSP